MPTRVNRKLAGKRIGSRRRKSVIDDVRDEVERILDQPLRGDQLRDRPLVELGIDSLSALTLKARLANRFGATVDLPRLLDDYAIADIAREVGDQLGTKKGDRNERE